MKKRFAISLLVVGLVIGLLLTWQFFSKAPISSSFLTDELQAKEDLFKDFLDEQAYLQSRIVFLREEMEETEKSLESQLEFSSINFLDNLKKDVGLTEINGKGIEILLDDSPFALRSGVEVSDTELVQAADIRDIVNILNAANAEAISVNNQRVIATSPISSVGTTILINNAHTAPPFTINAVGDVDLMLQRLQNDSLLSSLYERVSKYDLVLQFSVKEWIVVPIYNGDLNADYLNLID
jgi:uncharacterized protein YlxW (UPF0749 family)